MAFEDSLNAIQQKIHEIADCVRRDRVAKVGSFVHKTPLDRDAKVVVVTKEQADAVKDELALLVSDLKALVVAL